MYDVTGGNRLHIGNTYVLSNSFSRQCYISFQTDASRLIRCGPSNYSLMLIGLSWRPTTYINLKHC